MQPCGVVLAIMLAAAVGIFGLWTTQAFGGDLTIASTRGDAAAVRELLRRGHSPDDQNFLGLSALYSAILAGEIEVVRILLDAGADPNKPSGPVQRTPIQFAAKTRQLEIARLLLQRGADPNKPNKFGRTALYHLRDYEPPYKAVVDKSWQPASLNDMAALIQQYGGSE